MDERGSIEDVSDKNELEDIDLQLARIEQRIEKLKAKESELIERRNRIKLEQAAKENEVPVEQFYGVFPWTEKIRHLVQKKFGHSTLGETQEAALNCILSGTDSIVVMPAGSGKSLIYQLASQYLPGLVLVVTPLTSLLEDQVAAMEAIDPHFPVFGVHINLLKEDLNQIFVKMSFQAHHQSKLMLFVTPDKLSKSKQFMAKVTKTYEKKKLSLIVVDEAHCCASNGNDFRSDYQTLSSFRSTYPGVPIVALTSVASQLVVLDIANALNLGKRAVFRESSNLPNICYEVDFVEIGRPNVIGEIAMLIKKNYPEQAGIVCCFSVKDAEDVATVLVKDHGIKAKPYHHQLKMNYRSKVHKQWLTDKIHVIVVTSTFGMGINKPNCRFVVHYTLPKSLQNYYIETGRAGRRGQRANALCMFKFQDVFRLSSMVFTEKNGLKYLYRMIAYCLNRSKCRRQLLQESLSEGYGECPVVCSTDNLESMCDNCRNPQKRELVDVTEYVKLFSTIFEELSASGQRVTGWKLMDVFRKRLNKENAPAHIKEHVGQIIVWSLCEGYLEEKFHFTPYSTISHLAEGSRMKRLIEGSEKAELEMYGIQKRSIDMVDGCADSDETLVPNKAAKHDHLAVEKSASGIMDQVVQIHQMPQPMHLLQVQAQQQQPGQHILVQLVQDQQQMESTGSTQPLDQLAVAVQQVLQ
ncbi:putative ATP-dependent DNA helicase Q1 [Galendromus occidentalis]|uniref:ATP-dependent DNA helicase n=1 Tax=Galendromus occidentalis TaxID=34638 RepID=A0AAJ7L4I9_9ACAR|nr:putative ATP-dependent DNA helicase Q1 [Galendromus occidentalis]